MVLLTTSFHYFQMTWAVTFLSVCFINIDIGLGIGVFFSILTVVWRSQRYFVKKNHYSFFESYFNF